MIRFQVTRPVLHCVTSMHNAPTLHDVHPSTDVLHRKGQIVRFQASFGKAAEGVIVWHHAASNAKKVL